MADLASSISRGLAKNAVAAAVNDSLTDLTSSLKDGDVVRIVTADSDEGRHVLRHSTAHVMAQAVLDLFPGAKYTIGPAIENGFYYDFDLGGRAFTEDDLTRVEDRMREIVRVRAVAKNRATNAKDHRRMPPDDLGECLGVLVASPAGQ